MAASNLDIVLIPFHTTGLFLYAPPPKLSETIWFSDVFRGYGKRSVAKIALKP